MPIRNLCFETRSAFEIKACLSFTILLNENMANYQHTIDLPMPSPELLPEEVISVIMEALQQNDPLDLGIETIFNFASPGNKLATGTLDVFKKQLKTPLFQPMLNFSNYKSSELVTDGSQAQQILVIPDELGQDIGYLFTLSKQTEMPFQDCWMTDSIRRVKPEVYGITV
jgi:hypothetical protein